MRRNELKQLYDYYVKHTAVVEKMESVEEIHDYLEFNYLECGICYCSKMEFNKREAYDYFHYVRIFYPSRFTTKPEILSVLNQRIELLRSELLKNMQNFVDQLPSGFRKVEFDYLEYRGNNGLEIDINGNEIRVKGDPKYLMLWVEKIESTEHQDSTNPPLLIASVVPMLHKIAELIDTAVENGEDEKVSEIVELMKGIADDNWMFVRN
jgi:hypothetical protein